MIKTTKKYFTLMVMGIICGNLANAALLAGYNNDALTNPATSAPVTTTGAGVSNSAITQGPGVASVSGWPDGIGTRDNTSTTLAASIGNDDYFTLTIAPTGGNEIDFTDFFVLTTTANSTGAGGNLALFSSASGFAAANVLDTYTLDASGSVALKTFSTDLSGTTALQNITSTVEFRLYYYNLSNVGSRMQFGNAYSTDGLNDIAVSGLVSPIPEPSSLILVAVALVGTVSYRRR